MANQMTIEQFGQTIKQKYPQYNDMDSSVLGQKMLTKYPQYQDMVKQESLMSRISTPTDIEKTKGFIPTAAATAKNIGVSTVKNIAGLAAYPFTAAKTALYDLPKEIIGAGQDVAKGVSPLEIAKNYFNPIEGAKAAYKVLAPPALQEARQTIQQKKQAGGTAGQALAAGGFQALKSVAQDPYQLLPYALGAKGAIEKVPALDTAISKTAGAVTGIPGKLKTYAGVVKETISSAKSPEVKVADAKVAIQEGFEKGIKPSIIGKKTPQAQKQFFDSAQNSIKTIAENRSRLNLLNEKGEPTDKPQSVAQMAQALDQTKSFIYKKYNDMARQATGRDAMVNAAPAVQKLEAVTTNLGKSKAVREYAKNLIPEIQELDGQSPLVWEERIAEYNQSLQNYYKNPTAASQIEASVKSGLATIMREALDQSISNAEGPGYAGLKKEYGALKSIEADVNKRALAEAKKNVKDMPDILVDVFSGGEIVHGLWSLNPALVAKGVFGMGMKNYFKYLNSPDRYIKKMFDSAYEAYPETTPSPFFRSSGAIDYSRPMPMAETSGIVKNAVPPTQLKPEIRPGQKALPYSPDGTMPINVFPKTTFGKTYPGRNLKGQPFVEGEIVE